MILLACLPVRFVTVYLKSDKTIADQHKGPAPRLTAHTTPPYVLYIQEVGLGVEARAAPKVI